MSEVKKWCSHCKICFSQSKLDECLFCSQPLFVLSKENELKGEWQVCCSLGNKVTDGSQELILGRSNPQSYFLFLRNYFIDNKHACLQAQDGKILLQDCNSKAGTFILKHKSESPQIQNTSEEVYWCRLQEGEKAVLDSGNDILLGKETLVKLWLKWVPLNIDPEKKKKIQKAQNIVPLISDGNTSLLQNQALIYQLGNCYFLEDKKNNPLEAEISLNGKIIFISPVSLGDRISLAGQEYEFYTDKLRPAEPLLAPKFVLNEFTIPKRLNISHIQINPGQLVAILGESGSGKSTFIKAITGWIEADWKSSEIQRGEEKISPQEVQNYTAYVPQHDVIYEDLSIKNSLFYSAFLKSQKVDIEKWQKKICQILIQMNLLHKQNDKICHLSGGQRKRVNIGQALLSEEASLLILDEPTSGLDNINHNEIIKLLRRLSNQGRTVLCITHNLENLQLFDQVIVLKRGGYVEFSDKPECMLQKYSQEFSGTDLSSTPSSLIAKNDISEKQLNIQPPKFLSLLPFKWWTLLVRKFDEFLHPSQLIFLFSLLLIIPSFIGLMVGLSTQSGKNENLKAFFLCSVASFWLGMSIAAGELKKSRYKIFLHEKASGISSTSVFFSYLPFYLLIPFIQSFLLVSFHWLAYRDNFCFFSQSFSSDVTYNITLFLGLTWLMGVSGALLGLNMSLIESKYKISTAVSIPCITVLQLVFSYLVMQFPTDYFSEYGYFSFPIENVRDVIYYGIFSRYIDLAYRCYMEVETYSSKFIHFYYNIAIFSVIGLIIPSISLWFFLKISKATETD